MATSFTIPKIETEHSDESVKLAAGTERSEDVKSVCGICLSDLKSPSTLSCLHAFCQDCLQDWARHVSGSVTCPKCRCQANLRSGSINGFVHRTPPPSPSSRRSSTSSYRRRPHRKSRGHQIELCTICRCPENEVVARCQKCNGLCEPCITRHSTLYQGQNSHPVDFFVITKKGDKSEVNSRKRWILEDTFGDDDKNGLKDARNVAHTPSGYFIATDCNNESLVKVFNRYGTFKFSFDTKLDQDPISVPYGIVVSSSGQFFVTDESPWVKVFNPDGVPLNQFPAVSPSGKASNEEPTWIMGLAIDGTGQIIVGETRQMYISFHKQDGHYVSSVKVTIRPHYIAITSNNEIIISSGRDNKIMVVDLKGNLLHTITSYSARLHASWSPIGVCCNASNEILVADATIGHEGIYRFSVRGRYLGCVTRCVSNPHGISMTRDGQRLVVAEDRCLKLFRYSAN